MCVGGREAGRRRPGRGSGRRGGNGGAANQRAAHQLTAFAYTRCTPAARRTKRGAPRAPAASLGASEAVRRARTALRVDRGTGGVSPGVGVLAVASLGAPAPSSGPGRTLPRPLHPTYPTLLPNPACLCPGPRELDRAQAGAAAVARVAASPTVVVLCRAPKEPLRAAGWEGGSAQRVLLLCLLLPRQVPVGAHPDIPAGRASG